MKNYSFLLLIFFSIFLLGFGSRDWEKDQETVNIHINNIPNLSGIYSSTSHNHDLAYQQISAALTIYATITPSTDMQDFLSSADYAAILSKINTAQVASSAKTTPIDNDKFNFFDSASSYISKIITWAEIKTVLTTALILDEDDMASNSTTQAPSQQSVATYVASGLATKQNTVSNDTLPEGVITSRNIENGEVAAIDLAPDAGGTIQSVAISDAGTLTPTAGYKNILVLLTPNDVTTNIVVSETGPINDADVYIINIHSTNVAVFANAANNLELHQPSITLKANQILHIKYVSDRWDRISDTSNIMFVKAIGLPTYYASELNDTSDPHLLTVEELMNSNISNGESIGADEWDFPARTEGWNFCFIIEVAQNVTLKPNGTEQWYFNGVQMSAGESIVNNSPTIGEKICCTSTEQIVEWNSKYTDWAQETP